MGIKETVCESTVNPNILICLYNQVEIQARGILENNQLLNTLVEEFICDLRLNLFEEEPIEFIKKSINIALVAHKGQERKNEVDEDGNKKPYFVHLLRVAQTLVNEGFKDEVLISASLLHDAPEDTQLVIDETTIKNCQKNSPQNELEMTPTKNEKTKTVDWFEFIAQIFKGKGKPLAQAIQGTTKPSQSEIEEYLPENSYLTNFFEKISLDFGEEITENKKQKIKQVIASIMKALDFSFKDEHLRSLMIKIADVADNTTDLIATSQKSEQPSVSVEKRIRAYIIANIAIYLGWFSMAQKILNNIRIFIDPTSIQNTITPTINKDEELPDISDFIDSLNLFDLRSCYLFHIVPPRLNSTKTNKTIPFLVLIPNELLSLKSLIQAHYKDNKNPRFTIKICRQGGSGAQIQSGFIAEWNKLTERKTQEGLIKRRGKDSSGFSGGLIIFEPGQTFIIDYLKNPNLDQSPEQGLFKTPPNINDGDWKTVHLVNLTSFFYDQLLPFKRGFGITIIAVNIGKEKFVVFAHKNKTLSDVLGLLNLPKNQAISIETTRQGVSPQLRTTIGDLIHTNRHYPFFRTLRLTIKN